MFKRLLGGGGGSSSASHSPRNCSPITCKSSRRETSTSSAFDPCGTDQPKQSLHRTFTSDFIVSTKKKPNVRQSWRAKLPRHESDSSSVVFLDEEVGSGEKKKKASSTKRNRRRAESSDADQLMKVGALALDESPRLHTITSSASAGKKKAAVADSKMSKKLLQQQEVVAVDGEAVVTCCNTLSVNDYNEETRTILADSSSTFASAVCNLDNKNNDIGGGVSSCLVQESEKHEEEEEYTFTASCTNKTFSSFSSSITAHAPTASEAASTSSAPSGVVRRCMTKHMKARDYQLVMNFFLEVATSSAAMGTTSSTSLISQRDLLSCGEQFRECITSSIGIIDHYMFIDIEETHGSSSSSNASTASSSSAPVASKHAKREKMYYSKVVAVVSIMLYSKPWYRDKTLRVVDLAVAHQFASNPYLLDCVVNYVVQLAHRKGCTQVYLLPSMSKRTNCSSRSSRSRLKEDDPE